MHTPGQAREAASFDCHLAAATEVLEARSPQSRSGARETQFPLIAGSGAVRTYWEIEKVTRDVPGGADVRVAATVNGSVEVMQLRMILEDADGNVGVTHEDSTWRVGIWAPRTYFGKSS